MIVVKVGEIKLILAYYYKIIQAERKEANAKLVFFIIVTVTVANYIHNKGKLLTNLSLAKKLMKNEECL